MTMVSASSHIHSRQLSGPAVDTLIIVACHAIYLGGPTKGEDESEWLIESFQAGETPTFIEHIRRGVEELAKSHGQAILAFSGGATKALKTHGAVTKTEARGYLELAFERDLFGFHTVPDKASVNLSRRMFEEPYATDSYQNILLSLIQYSTWQLHTRLSSDTDFPAESTASIPKISTLTLPKHLIIVSHEFKQARFMGLHLPAIRSLWGNEQDFDGMSVEYIGINPPFDEKKIREIEEGDRRKGYGAWKVDRFGTGELLSGKRRERGWDKERFLESLGVWVDGEVVERVRRTML